MSFGTLHLEQGLGMTEQQILMKPTTEIAIHLHHQNATVLTQIPMIGDLYLHQGTPTTEKEQIPTQDHPLSIMEEGEFA